MIAPSYTISRVPDVDPDETGTSCVVTPLRAALTDAERAVLAHFARGGTWTSVRYLRAALAVRARGLVVVRHTRGPSLTDAGRAALRGAR
jgi:hypothetical protein